MIEVRDLSKRYGDKLAVDHLTFTVRPGLVTGFLGPNGAGKSTTMRMILGLDRPTTGSVTVNGKAYRDHAAPLREVGAILEARAIHTGRSAYNHLLALAQTHGIPRSRVDEVIELVGLQDVARKRVGAFSLGMGQRLGIAAALLGDPKTLILDEPSNGLDPEGIRWIRNLLRSLAARGQDGARLVAPDERDEHDGRLARRRRPRAPDRRHDRRGLRPARRRRRRARAHARRASGCASIAAHARGRHRHGRRERRPATAALSLQGISCEAVGELAAANRIVLHELAPEQASLEEAFMRLTMDSVEYHAAPTARRDLGRSGPMSAAASAPRSPATPSPRTASRSRGVVRSEWTKLWSLRSTRWALLVSVVGDGRARHPHRRRPDGALEPDEPARPRDVRPRRHRASAAGTWHSSRSACSACC